MLFPFAANKTYELPSILCIDKIINITEEVYEIARDEIKQIEENQELPLIVKIPNSN